MSHLSVSYIEALFYQCVYDTLQIFFFVVLKTCGHAGIKQLKIAQHFFFINAVLEHKYYCHVK